MKTIKYQDLSDYYEAQIKKGILKTGDKMPSLRQICSEKKISMTTAQMVYSVLESKDLIVSKPKSGYIVCSPYNHKIQLPEATNPLQKAENSRPEDAAINVYDTIDQKHIVQLSLGIPATSFLPVAALNKCIKNAVNTIDYCGVQYDPIEGNSRLRQQIAKRTLHWNGSITLEDVITTSGCIPALSYCLQSITQPGDTIAVESPVYFGILQLAKHLRLKVVELSTHPQTGINLDSLEKLLKKQEIATLVIVSNFSNPLGYCMPDDKKEKLVQLMTQYNIPLIEDDIYGDLYFGEKRPANCKTFDKEGMVLLCNSISKSLAPGYRVGWILPGKYKDKVIKTKAIQQISDTAITHQAVALYLESGKYEKHLRKLRQDLYVNYVKVTKAILEYFPDETRCTQPQGGLFLWVELDKSINAFTLYKKALQKNIAIMPGIAFSLQDQYTHCIRLSYASEWNDDVEKAIKELGILIHSMSYVK